MEIKIESLEDKSSWPMNLGSEEIATVTASAEAIHQGIWRGLQKKVTDCHFFVFFVPVPGNDETVTVGAYFGQVLMYTEPQKKNPKQKYYFFVEKFHFENFAPKNPLVKFEILW